MSRLKARVAIREFAYLRKKRRWGAGLKSGSSYAGKTGVKPFKDIVKEKAKNILNRWEG